MIILEERLGNVEDKIFEFARGVIRLCKQLDQNVINLRLNKQLIKSSMLVGAHYIEAKESLSKEDYFFRIKSSRKECHESAYWLMLLQMENTHFYKELEFLINQSWELRKVFNSMIQDSDNM